MENQTPTIQPKHDLKKIYNIIDWIDLGLVGAIIWYYSRLFSRIDLSGMTEFDYTAFMRLSVENVTPLGVILLLVSLAVCVTFIVLTVKMRRAGQISATRAVLRMAWNLIWIPLDLYYLFLIFFTR
ncbi:MAG: hypothetical protein FWE40_06365 [Oscillospiraceae bacterium]|nr:hypothetical protein [Oscillospiraceae bacterium]